MSEFIHMLGFKGVLEINTIGKIKSLARSGTPEKILKSSVGTRGYLRVSFRVFWKTVHKKRA